MACQGQFLWGAFFASSSFRKGSFLYQSEMRFKVINDLDLGTYGQKCAGFVSFVSIWCENFHVPALFRKVRQHRRHQFVRAESLNICARSFDSE